jgi:hypothetical protein
MDPWAILYKFFKCGTEFGDFKNTKFVSQALIPCRYSQQYQSQQKSVQRVLIPHEKYLRGAWYLAEICFKGSDIPPR